MPVDDLISHTVYSVFSIGTVLQFPQFVSLRVRGRRLDPEKPLVPELVPENFDFMHPPVPDEGAHRGDDSPLRASRTLQTQSTLGVSERVSEVPAAEDCAEAWTRGKAQR